MRKNTGLVLTLCALLGCGSAFAAAPQLLSLQGRLVQGGSPITVPTSVTVRLYNDALSTHPHDLIHTESEVLGPDGNGDFTATLGDSAALDPEVFGQRLWAEIEIDADDTVLRPRIGLTAAPRALVTSVAEDLTVQNLVYVSVEQGGGGTVSQRGRELFRPLLLHLPLRVQDRQWHRRVLLLRGAGWHRDLEDL